MDTRITTLASALLLALVAGCGGSGGTLQTMVDWVEKGVAPDTISARAAATNSYFPNRTRPLRAYPKFAKYKYKGTGSIEDVANFACSAS